LIWHRATRSVAIVQSYEAGRAPPHPRPGRGHLYAPRVPFGFFRRRDRRPPLLTVDEPVGGVAISGGTVLIRGWAVDGGRRHEGSVVVSAGDREFPTRRRARPDVAAHLDLRRRDLPVGFVAAIDRRQLPARGHLSVRARFGDEILSAEPVPFTNAVGEPVPTDAIGSCPVCGGRDRVDVGSSDGLRMARCEACAVVYTVDRPTAGFMTARYSPTYFEDEYLPALEAEAAEMVDHWGRLLDGIEPYRRPGATLFEIGTGAGRFLVEARRRGWQVSGIDINEAAVAYGRDHHGLDLRCGSAEDEIGPLGSYDAVVSEMSLEHLPDPGAVIERAAAALRPGGVLMVFTVSGDGDSFATLGMASPLVGPAEHLFLFSARSLRLLAERASLEPIHDWTDDTGDAVGLLARKPA